MIPAHLFRRRLTRVVEMNAYTIASTTAGISAQALP
jgi:hypothetical protein